MTDIVLFWNEVALEANRVSHTREPKEQAGPPLSARALAIVHLAMYDAHAAVAGGGIPTYLPPPPVPAGAGAAAAVAGAAFAALSGLFPSQQAFFDLKLGQGGNPLDPGHGFGVEVARALLADRRRDPGAGGEYVPSTAPGRHRVDPDNPLQGFHAPYYGSRARLFAAPNALRNFLDAPPYLSPGGPDGFDQEYLSALRQVRARGIAPELMGTLPAAVAGQPLHKRTPDQTVVGILWGYDGSAGLGTPPRLYNQVLRRLAVHRNNTPAQNAELFARANVAMADAGILAWEEKYRHDFWRPVLGIREHDRSLGPAAPAARNDLLNDADTNWLPLGAPATNALTQGGQGPTSPSFPFNQMELSRVKNFTPPFPAYPSGHATFGAAAFHAARLFYGVPAGNRGDDALFAGLDVVSDEFNGVNQDNRGRVRPRHRRAFPGGLWQMIVENGESRVFLGVHWVFDAFAPDAAGKPDLTRRVGGVRLGVEIAEAIAAGGLKPPA